jgi:hypothetical protein
MDSQIIFQVGLTFAFCFVLFILARLYEATRIVNARVTILADLVRHYQEGGGRTHPQRTEDSASGAAPSAATSAALGAEPNSPVAGHSVFPGPRPAAPAPATPTDHTASAAESPASWLGDLSPAAQTAAAPPSPFEPAPSAAVQPSDLPPPPAAFTARPSGAPTDHPANVAVAVSHVEVLSEPSPEVKHYEEEDRRLQVALRGDFTYRGVGSRGDDLGQSQDSKEPSRGLKTAPSNV